MQRLRYGTKKSQRLLAPSRIVKEHETGFADFITFCEDICTSCDECPRYFADCDGNPRTQPWSDANEYINEAFLYNVVCSDNSVFNGFAVDHTTI